MLGLLSTSNTEGSQVHTTSNLEVVGHRLHKCISEVWDLFRFLYEPRAYGSTLPWRDFLLKCEYFAYRLESAIHRLWLVWLVNIFTLECP